MLRVCSLFSRNAGKLNDDGYVFLLNSPLHNTIVKKRMKPKEIKGKAFARNLRSRCWVADQRPVCPTSPAYFQASVRAFRHE